MTIKTTTKSTTKPSQPASKSLNDKLAELDQKVEWFYSDDFQLEQATENYKSAAALAREIQQDLQTLKNEIEILAEDFTK